MNHSNIYQFRKKESSVNIKLSLGTIDKEIDNLEQAKSMLSYAAEIAGIKLRKNNIDGKRFYVNEESVNALCKWVMTKRQGNEPTVAFIADDGYKLEVHFSLADTCIESNCILTRLNEHCVKEIFDFENKEWHEFPCYKNKNGKILPLTAEYEFFSVLLKMIGETADSNYDHIKWKNDKLIKLAAKLPKGMMKFEFLEKDPDRLLGIVDDEYPIALVPTGEINGFAIRQKNDRLQVCQYISGDLFAGVADNLCNVGAEFESLKDAIEYTMFVLDHYYEEKIYVFPLTENSYVKYDTIIQKGKIVNTDTVSDRDRTKWDDLKDYLNDHKLR